MQRQKKKLIDKFDSSSIRKGFLDDEDEDIYNKYNKERHSVSWYWPLVILTGGIVLYYLIVLNDDILPNVVRIDELKKNPNLFSGERSSMISARFQSLGPRVVGSNANEVEAPKIIEDEIDEIIKNANSAQTILRERQIGSGSYNLLYKPPFINAYANVQNVIVMVEGSSGEHSVLVNCHYDSVPTSKGASDDIISCAAMLEIIRILSISPIRLKHNAVFLFNGAEETPLQASHLFLKHDWAKKCRLFLNLEAAGLGGRNALFQFGPKNAWMFKYYVNHVPYPHGQVLGEELFQNGLIPSDTDFRIFRDFGNMPGLDFAFFRNGYVYHTKYDDEKYLPMGSHQNVGENTLALVKAFGNAPELENMEANSEGSAVYYDYLGWFMISYTVTINFILNMGSVLLGVCSVILFIGHRRRWSILKELMISSAFQVLSILAAIMVVAIVAIIIDSTAPFAMSWYSNAWLIFPFYWCPSLIMYIFVLHTVNRFRIKKHKLSLTKMTQMNLIAAQFPWMALSFIITILGFRAGHLFFLSTVTSAIANIVIHITPLHRTVYRWIWFYLAVHIPSLAFNMYAVLMCYMFFIPIFGRTGPINHDLSMGIISALFVFLVVNFALPLMSFVKKPSLTVLYLGVFSLAMIVISSTTYVGHPYKIEQSIPKPQRYMISHTHRQFNDEHQLARRNESGYFIFNLDRNSPRSISIDKQRIQSFVQDCKDELNCGLPLFSPRMLSVVPKCNWIPANAPYQPIETELKLSNNKPHCLIDSSICNLELNLYGPDRMTLTFAPREGASLVSWSLESDIKATGEWKNQPSYFVNICRGNVTEPFKVSLKFKVSRKQLSGEPILDIGLAGNHVHHEDERTTEFKDFIGGLPEWVEVVSWISAYKSYIF